MVDVEDVNGVQWEILRNVGACTTSRAGELALD